MKHSTLALPEPFQYQDFRNAFQSLATAMDQGAPYLLLTGDSGTGKTTLLRALEKTLDRRRFQVLYLSHSDFTPAALVRFLAEALHLPMRTRRPETIRLMIQTLRSLPTKLLLWVDEAQRIHDETFHEIRSLSEASLEAPPLLTVLFSALPELKDRLLDPALFALWRRISPRTSLTGLLREELSPFLAHLLGKESASRFSDDALSILFEHGRGVPALLATSASACLHHHPKGPISTAIFAEVLDRLQSH